MRPQQSPAATCETPPAADEAAAGSSSEPYRLSVWVSIASNVKAFKPSTKAILARYMLKFSKGGTVDLAADAGLDLKTEAE